MTSSEICVDMCQSDDEHVNDILTEESNTVESGEQFPECEEKKPNEFKKESCDTNRMNDVSQQVQDDIRSDHISPETPSVSNGPSSPTNSSKDNDIKLPTTSTQANSIRELNFLSSSQHMCPSSSLLMNMANQSQENIFLQKQQPFLQTSFMQTLLALNNNASTRPPMLSLIEGYVEYLRSFKII